MDVRSIKYVFVHNLSDPPTSIAIFCVVTSSWIPTTVWIWGRYDVFYESSQKTVIYCNTVCDL